ncbi:fimbrial subunit FimA [Bifidobacterium pseudolongum subsp. globosum]|uniref:Fimbrial subunit FimA n=2 Tax=Bifidobacterium pseudolongum TaxID=1694 RepID=A0A4Q4ZZB7_9BIFI|nr:fimbrial subunit FimA [Bifidobacterium pseudolongum subsp. globosum]
MVFPAQAAEVSNDGITIIAPTASDDNNLVPATVNGRTFTAYKLADYRDVVVHDGSVTSYDLTPADGITNDELDAWIKAAAVKGETVDPSLAGVLNPNGTFKDAAENMTPLQFIAKYMYGTGTDRYGNAQADNALMRAFATAAKADLKNAANVRTVTATGENNAVSLDTQEAGPGMYLIVETTQQMPQGELISRAMVVGTAMESEPGGKYYDTVTDGTNTFTLGQIHLKAEKVEPTKEIKGDDQLVRIGSQRTFVITANVPDYTQYPDWTDQQYAISDNPTDNITIKDTQGNIDGLKVTASDDTPLAAGTEPQNYTVDLKSDTADPNDFSISLNDPTQWSGKTITVEYRGTIQNLDQDLTNNTATVDFSNNPDVSTSHSTISTTKNVYVAQIPLDKIKFNDASTKLSGATFSVKQGGKPVTFTKTTPNGKTLYTVDPRGKEQSITADSVDIAGLGADSSQPTTYTFTETKAPTGYILGAKPVSFTLTVTPTFDKTSNKNLTAVTYKIDSQDHANFIDLSDASVREGTAVDATKLANNTTKVVGGQIHVENTTSENDFAKTGGEITRVLIAVGVLAVLGAGFMIAARLRRRN